MNSFQRFEETELPSQADIFNGLSGDSDDDYAHALRVWRLS